MKNLEKINRIVELALTSGLGFNVSIQESCHSIRVYRIIKGKHVFIKEAVYAGNMAGYEHKDFTTLDKLIVSLEEYIKENGSSKA